MPHAREGWPPPADLPRGEFITRRADDGGICITRADPRILVSAEVLAEIFVAPPAGVSLSLPPPPRPQRYPPVHAPAFWEGAVLKITALNRTVVYRIADYVPSIYGYVGEWPD